MSHPRVKLFLPLAPLALFAITPVLAGIWFSYNFPRADDFDSCLRFLEQFSTSQSWSTRLQLVFSRHNEHLIVFTRAVVLVNHLLLGSINFVALTAIGVSAIILLFLLIYQDFAPIKKAENQISSLSFDRLLLFIAAVLLIFQLQYYDALNWPMASLNSFWVVVFVFLAMRSGVSIERFGLHLAVLWGIMAALTQANGVLVFPVLALLCAGLPGYRRRAGIWVAITFLGFACFAGSSRLPVEQGFSLVSIIDHSARFLGSGIGLGSTNLSRICGVFFLLYAASVSSSCFFAFGTPSSCEAGADTNKRLTLLGLVWFVVLTAIANALLRNHPHLLNSPPEFTPRYTFPSLVGWGSMLLLSAESAWLAKIKYSQLRRYGCVTVVLISLGLNLMSLWRCVPLLERSAQLLRLSALSWQIAGDGLLYPVSTQAAQLLRNSIALDIYQPPRQELASWLALQEVPERVGEWKDERAGQLPLQLQFVAVGSEYSVLHGWIYRPWNYDQQTHVTIVLERSISTSKEQLRFSAHPTLEVSGNGENYAVATGPTGFFALIPNALVPAGEYRLKISLSKPLLEKSSIDSKATLVDSGRVLTFGAHDGVL